MSAIAAPLIGLGFDLLTQPNKKDPERVQMGQDWYRRAIQPGGDAVALCKLKYMGGLRGMGSCGGEPSSGFATTFAKQNCENLYQQAVAVLSGAAPASAPLPAPPGEQAKQPDIGGTLRTISETTGSVATALGSPPQTLFKSGTGQIVMIGAAVLALVVVVIIARR